MLLNCKFCGGELEITDGDKITTCKYCRTTQTLPVIKDESASNLFNRANALRRRCDFDKAETAFEKIIEADGTEAEAYWGLVLSKYGIEYVEDPESGKMIPTCHRASYDSIASDGDYKSALEYADEERKAIYIEQAKEIDRIQKEILTLAENEEKYDVFICYKETDENGKRTHDSARASEIYYELTDAGFKVFYAAVTLDGKVGSEYEPIIFSALNSAKVMLVIGSKPEYFNAVWVKNEWSRFLKIMKNDRRKRIIPCYYNMDAYDLPEEFIHIQAQNMEKMAFLIDLIQGVKKVMESDITLPEVIETVLSVEDVKQPVVQETATESVINDNKRILYPNTDLLLRRAFLLLEDGDFKVANEYCEKVLDADPENAEAYLVKLMMEVGVNTKEDLENAEFDLECSNNYKKIIRFANPQLVNEIKQYAKIIQDRLKRNKEERDAKYQKEQLERKKREKRMFIVLIGAFIIGLISIISISSIHYHTLEYVPEKEATCIMSGNVSHYKCLGCDKKFLDATGKKQIKYITTPKSDHKYINCKCKWCSDVKHTYQNEICTACGNSLKPAGNLTEKSYSAGLEYTLNSNNTYYTVSGIGTCTDENIVIPSTYEGKPVKIIGYEAFYNCQGISNITLPDSIVSIEGYAFYNCHGLKSIIIEKNVTNIGGYAFKGCTGLTNIKYCGTQTAWTKIYKAYNWDLAAENYTITYDYKN